MISRIKGNISQRNQQSLIVDVGGIHYEVLLPSCVMRSLNEDSVIGDTIDLVTYHYLEVSMSRNTPVLIGFSHPVEKEFFERFITVAGIGPKAALKALALPIQQIARAIDDGDISLLKSLPGIGEQKARHIIAKLQGKVGKFALMKEELLPESEEKEDVQSEAIEILLQLQYKKAEAKDMVLEAMKRNPGISTAEELLNEVYKQKRK